MPPSVVAGRLHDPAWDARRHRRSGPTTPPRRIDAPISSVYRARPAAPVVHPPWNVSSTDPDANPAARRPSLPFLTVCPHLRRTGNRRAIAVV